MSQRFVSIWFRHLATDWFSLRNPELKKLPFVLRTSSHGRMIIKNTNAVAAAKGIGKGMVLADARAIYPDLIVKDDLLDLPQKLLRRLAEWCIRFSPFTSIDLPDGIFIDASGCSHLWGGDDSYIREITNKLNNRGYDVSVAIADTPGVAWGIARYGKGKMVIEEGKNLEAIKNLPPEALRIEPDPIWRLHRLGLHRIRDFIHLPRPSLRKRFGAQFLQRLDQALGQEIEVLQPVYPIELYQERLPCLEPIATATGIEIALDTLLHALCVRLQHDQKGLRLAVFKGYRIDGKIEEVQVSTNSPSCNVRHLSKLFSTKLSTIEPALGIELFVLEAPVVEEHLPQQEKIWEAASGLEDSRLSELMDRLGNRVGAQNIHRYLPSEHYWPERSYKEASTLSEQPATYWPNRLRPLQLLKEPEKIEVTAPIPDYPPMLFRYKNKIHKIVRADGPERIEQEWWIQQGQHRDYYYVEDEKGHRYWLFRLGHYDDKIFHWFIHGYFS